MNKSGDVYLTVIVERLKTVPSADAGSMKKDRLKEKTL